MEAEREGEIVELVDSVEGHQVPGLYIPPENLEKKLFQLVPSLVMMNKIDILMVPRPLQKFHPP